MAYILKGDRSGTIRFKPKVGTITDEGVSFSNKVTSFPIESGSNINDHATNDPINLSISGTIIGGTAESAKLEKMWKNRDLIDYQGKQRRNNLLMLSYNITESSENKNGFDFSASFQQMNIVTSQTVQIATGKSSAVTTSSKNTTKKSTTATKNSGRKTTSTQTVTSSSYLDSVNNVVAKNNNTTITSTRSTSSDSGYGR